MSNICTHTATIKNSATQKVLRTISLAHIKPVRDSQSSSSACVSDLVHIEHDYSYTDAKTVTTPIPAPKEQEFKKNDSAIKQPSPLDVPDDSDSSVIYVKTSSPPKKRQLTDTTENEHHAAKRIRRDIVLSERDISILNNTEWLTDSIIDKAQGLLTKQFPDIDSLQSVCLLQSAQSQGSIGSACGSWVQIINVSASHWITATNVNSPPDTVLIYDSLFSRKATETLVEKICVLNYFMSSTFLDIQIMDMQRQSGGDDCGLFAIASALCLCEGKDPGTQSWNQQSMRQHLLQCFADGELKPFQSEKRRKRAAKLTQRVQLYCTCKTTKKSDTMIKCCSCENVFHKKCINLAEDASYYKCNICW